MEGKSVLEVFLMPVVVAVIGVTGTVLITNAQEKSARELATAQLDVANSIARSEQTINIIATFSEKITSEKKSERELALAIIRSVDPVLSKTILEAIEFTENDIVKEIDGNTYSFAADSLARSKAAGSAADSDVNAGFTVGIYGLNVDEKAFEVAVDSVRSADYSIVASQLLDQKPGWISNASTVHYYSSESKQKAEELGKRLTEATGVPFQTNRGAGLGVPDKEKRTRFFIHYIG